MPKSKLISILSPALGGDTADDKPKNFYIWGYQPDFRLSLKIAADSLFHALECRAEHQSFLVAINIKEGDKNPSAVVEPEDISPDSSDFANVLELTKQLESAKQGTDYAWQSDNQESGKAWAKRSIHRDFCALVRQAVKQTVKDYYEHDNKRVYVSAWRQHGPYLIFSVITISQNAFETYPHLRRTQRDGYSYTVSLIDAACEALLAKCRDALLSSIAGDSFANLPTTEEIMRRAGESFMYTPFGACDDMDGLHGGFHACNEISTLTYEKVIGSGRLILCKTNHEYVDLNIKLANPTELRNYRATRKLLELAGAGEALICNSNTVLGVGHEVNGYDPGNEDLFTIEFVGHAIWRLVHCGVPLMLVEHGIPKLPQLDHKLNEFVSTYERLFPDLAEEYSLKIRRIARKASELNHGTIIIISNDAKDEAERFGNQATKIEPRELSTDLLERAARIDGAILISPQGTCFAIGVILDGVATEKGSSVRGSRFNSTVRYVNGRDVNSTLGVIVSDDGMIDVIPDYHAVMSRREIHRKIHGLSKLVKADDFDHDKFLLSMKWLHEHKFYLSKKKCGKVNKIRDLYDQVEDVGKRLRHVFHDLEPDPDMNKSFLRD